MKLNQNTKSFSVHITQIQIGRKFYYNYNWMNFLSHLQYLTRIVYNSEEVIFLHSYIVLLLTQKEQFNEPQELSSLSLKQTLGHGNLRVSENVANLSFRFLFILSFLKIGAIWTIGLLCDWKRCANSSIMVSLK